MELIIGFWLFKFDATAEWDAEEDHLAHITEAQGTPFDPDFLAKCSDRSKFFNADGSFAHFTTHEEPTLPLTKLPNTMRIILDAAAPDDLDEVSEALFDVGRKGKCKRVDQ